jgi:hypothetical protein
MRSLVIFVAVLVGCHEHVRYVRMAASPDKTREVVAGRAEQAGWKPERVGKGPWSRGLLRYRKHKDQLEARVVPDGGGALLELSAASEATLDLITPLGDTHRTTRWGLDRAHIDTSIDLGLARSIHTSFPWRLDWSIRGGNSVWTRGGDRRVRESRQRVLVVGGAGLMITDRPAFRPELGVMLDVQDTLKPFDRRLYAGERKAVSLTVGMPLGPQFWAIEGGVTIHVPPYGGVFGRIGYEWNEGRRGSTYMVGARLDTLPAGVAACALAAWILVEAWRRNPPSLEDLLDTGKN